jgi:hypothetical protein
MKNLLTTIAIICITVISATAQSNSFGTRVGYNFELSLQHPVASNSGMVEFDAGVTPFITQKGIMYNEDGTSSDRRYTYGRVQAVIAYDWIMDILPSFYWYAGAAIGVSWGYGEFFDNPHYDKNGKLITYRKLGLPIGARIGLEYEFKSPINISVDWRPMINVFGISQGDYTSYLYSFSLGVRYRF